MKKTLLTFCLMACASLMSLNAATNIVLHADFENGMPTGWTQEYVSLPITLGVDTADFSWGVESSDSLVYPTGAFSGNGRAFARNSSSDEMRFVTRLVTPVMNLNSVFQPQLLFSHSEVAVAGSSDTLKVYYRTSANDYWHPYPELVFARNAAWKQELVSIIAPSNAYQLAFEITENFGRGVVLDDIIVRATPTCQDVANIVASNVHAYDATLSWDANGAYNNFEVMVTTQQVTDFSNIPDSIVAVLQSDVYNPEAVVTGLQPQTNYYVYVRSDCEENESGFTNWVESSFTTLAIAFLPYTQNFNSSVAILGNTNYAKPQGWMTGTDLDVDVPYVYRVNTSTSRIAYSVDTTAYLAFNGSFTATSDPIPTDHYAYAVTPEVNCTSLQGAQVDFWATAYNMVSSGINQYAATLYVGVMTDPANYRTIQIIDTVKIETAYMFKHVSVSLAEYTGTGKFIALYSKSPLQNAVYVDNFHVEVPEVTTPNHIRLANANVKGFTVKADIHDADSWNLKVATSYKRNGADVPDSLVVYSQTGLTGAQHVIALNDSSLAGKIVMVYVQGVKGGQTSPWAFPVTIRVPRAVTSYPYTCSFEAADGQVALTSLNHEIRTNLSYSGAAGVYFPVTNIDQSVNNYPRLVSTQPNYRGAHVQLTGIDNWFCLPEIDTISTLQLVFRYATLSGQAGKVEVGVMTDPYDLSTFSHVSTFSTEDNSYVRCVVAFDSYQGNGKYIAFRSVDAASGASASVNLIDEAVVSKVGNCREASNIAVNANSTSAQISWNGSNMDGWIVGLSSSRTMMSATYQTVDTPAATFNALEPETRYYYTITTICGSDTIWAEDVHYFDTPLGLPFEERFLTNAMPSGWTMASVSASNVFNGASIADHLSTYGWSISSNSTGYYYTTNYLFAPQEGYGAVVEVWSTGCYKWLLSPVLYIDAPDAEELELTFDLGVHGYNGSASAGTDDQFMVLVSADGGNTWNRQNATVWNNKADGDFSLNDLDWEAAQSISIDFTRFIGKKIQFAFYGESTVSNKDNYFSVDNISLRVADPACGGLTNLRASATSGTDATVTWTLAGINPHPAIVEISKSPTFSQIISSQIVNGQSLQYNNLQPSTHYYVRARQSCDNDAVWQTADIRTACEAFVPENYGPETFRSAGSLDCWKVGFLYSNGAGTEPQYVSNAQFGGVLEISKSSTDDDASDGAYAISPEFDITDSITNYQVVFSAASCSSLSTNIHRLVVGVVTDPADPSYTFSPVATINLASATDSMDMKTYAVSLEDYEGDIDGNFGRYVMFLSEAGADSTNHIYLDNFFIEKAQGCRQVINLEADSVTVGGALLTWSGNGQTYEVAVAGQNIDPATQDTAFLVHTFVSGNSYRVSGLEATTTYYAYIRTICGEGDSARWSSATRFSTSYGVPFVEGWPDATIDEDKWTLKSGLFTADSIKMENMSPLTSGYNCWRAVAVPSGLTGMSGNAVRNNIYSTGCAAWLISPEIDMTLIRNAQVTLSFAAALTEYGGTTTGAPGADDRLAVVISTDGGATWKQKDATWFPMGQLSNSAKRLSVSLDDYIGKSIRFAIYDESTVSNSDNYMYVDSIAITMIDATCLGARNLKAELTNDSTVKVSWRLLGIPDSMCVRLALDPQITRVVDSLITDQKEAEFTHLALNQLYFVETQQIGCDSKVQTSFRTPYCVPFMEDFNLAALPEGWSLMTGDVYDVFADSALVPASNSLGWKISTSSNGLAANHLYGEMYYGSSTNKQWIVSPAIVLPESGEHLALLFDLALTAHNKATAPTNVTGQEFRVLLSTDNGATWSPADSWLFDSSDNAYMQLADVDSAGTAIQLSLDPYYGEKVRFAFYKSSSSSTTDNDLHIANVQLREVGEPCDDPTGLFADTVSFTYARLAWDDAADLTVVEYSTESNFAAALVDTVRSASWCRISGLQPKTTYYARIKNICGENSISGYSNSISFTTSIGLPYIESFEGVALANANKELGDWERYNGVIADVIAGTAQLAATTSSSAGWRASNLQTILGGDHVYCPRSGTEQWLISPEIDLTPDADAEVIAFSFDMAKSKTYNKVDDPALSVANQALQHFHVLVSTDNGASWSWDNEWLWSQADSADFSFADIQTGAGSNYQLDFTRFGGQKIRIALVMGKASTGTICLNVNNVVLDRLESSCFGVSNMITNSVDTAAHLTLVPADNASRWEVVYGRSGLAVDSMPNSFETDSLNFVLHNLALTTSYDIYARSICGEGDTSVWAGPFQLITPQGLSYEYDLQTLGEWTRYSGKPSQIFADSAQLAPVTVGWTAMTNDIQLGEPHMYCTTNASTSYWLVSPSINLMPQDGTKSIYLNFDAALTSSANTAAAPTTTTGHKLIVAISEDDGAHWQAANSWVFGDSTDYALYKDIPAGMGQTFHIDATRVAGKVIRIAFIKQAASSGASCVHINNVSMDEYSVPCFAPLSLTATVMGDVAVCKAVASDSTVTTGWQYAIGAVGFTPTDAKAVTVSSGDFNIQGLAMSSTYDIYVRSLCGAEDTSAWFGPTTVRTALGIRYEETFASSSMPADWSVYSGTLSNLTSTTGGWYCGRAGNGFAVTHAYVNSYSTYKYLLASPVIDMSNITRNSVQLSFDMALTAYNSASAPSSFVNQSVTVVVSTDNGASWQEMAKWGDASADYLYSSIPATGQNYQVDLTDFVGEKVRVGIYAACTAAGADNDVHVRNLVIDTVPGGYCMPVTRASVLDSTYNSMTVAFRAPGIADALHVQYICLPEYSLFNASQAVMIDTNVVTITGLQSSMGYDLYARVMCQDSTWTDWKGPFTHHTVECSAPTSITQKTVTLESAEFQINAADAKAALGYQYFVTEHEGVLDPTQAVTIQSNTAQFAYNFLPSSVYDVYVRKICNSVDTSEWAGPFELKTPYGIRYEDDLNWSSWSSEWKRYQSLTSLAEVSTGWTVGRAGYGFEDAHVWANAYSSNCHFMASPEIDLSNIPATSPLELSVDLALTKYNSASAPTNVANQAFYILINTGGTWSTNQGFSWKATGGDYVYADIPADGGKFTLDMSQYAGQKIRIGFYSESNSTSYSGPDNDIHIQNVVLDTLGGGSATCPGIESVIISNVDLSSATMEVAYKESSDPMQRLKGYYEVATDNQFQTVILGDTIFDKFALITGLQPSTTYFVRVRQVCDNEDESAFSRTANFTTSFGVRFLEDFEQSAGLGEWRYSSQSPTGVFAGTSQLQLTTSGSWYRVAQDAVMDSYHMRFNIYSTYNAWLVSPVIDLTPNVGDALLFAADLAMCAYSGMGAPAVSTDDEFYIAVSDDQGQTWSKANATIWGSGAVRTYPLSNLNEVPSRVLIDFSKYAGKKIRIAFVGASSQYGTDNYLMIDNVDLNKSTAYDYNDTICSGSDYADYGFSLTADQLTAGAHQFTYISQGLDSVVHLNLFVKESPYIEYTATICEGEIFSQYGFNMQPTVSDDYKRRLTATNGCDSLVVVHLTVNPIIRAEVDQDVCAGTSVTIGGKTYYNNAVARDTLSSLVTGCDSITTYYLTFTDQAQLETTIDRVACQGDYYSDDLFNYNRAGQYIKTTTSSTGCDSTVTLNLYVADIAGIVYDTVLVEDLPYTFNGQTLIAEGAEVGEREFTVESTCGTATLKVMVQEFTALDNVAEGELAIVPNPASVGEDILILSDLIYTKDFRLTIYDAVGRLVYMSTEARNTIPGLPVAGYYTVRVSNAGANFQAKLLVK